MARRERQADTKQVEILGRIHQLVMVGLILSLMTSCTSKSKSVWERPWGCIRGFDSKYYCDVMNDHDGDEVTWEQWGGTGETDSSIAFKCTSTESWDDYDSNQSDY